VVFFAPNLMGHPDNYIMAVSLALAEAQASTDHTTNPPAYAKLHASWARSWAYGIEVRFPLVFYLHTISFFVALILDSAVSGACVSSYALFWLLYLISILAIDLWNQAALNTEIGDIAALYVDEERKLALALVTMPPVK